MKNSMLTSLCAATLLFSAGQALAGPTKQSLQKHRAPQAIHEWAEKAFEAMKNLKPIDAPEKSILPTIYIGAQKNIIKKLGRATVFSTRDSIHFGTHSSVGKKNINEIDKWDLIATVHQVAHFFLKHMTTKKSFLSNQEEFEAHDLTTLVLDKLGRHDLVELLVNIELLKQRGFGCKHFLGMVNGLSKLDPIKKEMILTKLDILFKNDDFLPQDLIRPERGLSKILAKKVTSKEEKKKKLTWEWKPQDSYDDAVSLVEELLKSPF